MGAESILLLPKGEELIKWKQCSGGGGVCVCMCMCMCMCMCVCVCVCVCVLCVCVRYREISHSWRGNPVLKHASSAVWVCCVSLLCVCMCFTVQKTLSFEGMPESLSEQIKTLTFLWSHISSVWPVQAPRCFTRLKRDYMTNHGSYLSPSLPVFSPRSALIYLDLPVGNGFSKPCQIDKLCLLFSVQLDNVDEQGGADPQRAGRATAAGRENSQSKKTSAVSLFMGKTPTHCW